jgi:hypothetical protein
MPIYRRAPDTRVNLALIILTFLALVAVGWSLRAGRIASRLEPTPAQPGAPGPPGARGAPGTAPALPAAP